MRKKIEVTVKKPQFSVTTDVSFAQVDAWYGHTRMDLKMDIIYPEDDTRLYPCVVWVCGGAWMKMDKSAHLLIFPNLHERVLSWQVSSIVPAMRNRSRQLLKM